MTKCHISQHTTHYESLSALASLLLAIFHKFVLSLADFNGDYGGFVGATAVTSRVTGPWCYHCLPGMVTAAVARPGPLDEPGREQAPRA